MGPTFCLFVLIVLLGTDNCQGPSWGAVLILTQVVTLLAVGVNWLYSISMIALISLANSVYFFSLVISQITNKIKLTIAHKKNRRKTPIPVPASQALTYSSVSHEAPAIPLMTQIKKNTCVPIINFFNIVCLSKISWGEQFSDILRSFI